MQQRAAKYSHDPGPGGLGPVLLVLVISAALIWVGSLVWIDNSMAIIPDNDPATFVNPQSISGFGSAGGPGHQIQSDRHDCNSGSTQQVVWGNGDQDDNREEYFTLLPLVGTLGQSGMWSISANYNQSRQISIAAPVSKVRTEAKPQPRPGGFTQRRTAVAYKDFGHLKVMSAEVGISRFRYPSFRHETGFPGSMGGLSYCPQSCRLLQKLSASVGWPLFLGQPGPTIDPWSGRFAMLELDEKGD